jgi:queuine tRNA-ribosyltransferase
MQLVLEDPNLPLQPMRLEKEMNSGDFSIEAIDKGSSARAGILKTAHGEIPTPIFMPVGTVGSVKMIQQRDLDREIRAKIILGNTYHLYLRPGIDILKAAGGLHRFMGWSGPILTDSGGFQVYSLSHRRKITEEGCVFQSHIDGSKHFFTPENVMDTQRAIGGDIIMAFDECPPYPSEYGYAKKSMEMTHRWLDRCIERWKNTDPLYGHHQILAPIVQGSTYNDLRLESAEFIASRDMSINAIGGVSVGEPAPEMYRITEKVCSVLPKDKPRYLMGVGTPENLLECISLGVDMFDCVLPTRNARHGLLYTTQGIIHIKNKKWAEDFSVLDPGIPALTSRTHTKAYLRHLFVAQESLGGQIASLQNLSFFLWLVGEARKAILEGNFPQWKTETLKVIMQKL